MLTVEIFVYQVEVLNVGIGMLFNLCRVLVHTIIKMAENSKMIGKGLFTNEDGSPMVFFMRPCSEKQMLRPIIEVCVNKLML